MRSMDLLKLALLNLSRRRSRTFLTMLGVAVGTACIALLLSIGWSNYMQFADAIEERAGLERIEVYAYAQDGAKGGISEGTLGELSSIAHVKAVSPILEIPAVLRAGPYEAACMLTGIDSSVLDMEFSYGGMFPDTAGALELTFGGRAAQQFTDPANPPDYHDWKAMESYRPAIDWETASVFVQFGYPAGEEEAEQERGAEYRARVSGEAKENNGPDDDRIYVSLENAKRLRAENRAAAQDLGVPMTTYKRALIRADDMRNVPEILEEIRSFGFETYSESEYISQMREEQSRQQGQLLAIGLISLFVSAIGIANTMYASVLERRRSIGIMKVIGMSTKKIRALFLTEAALIGIVGGLLGLLVSFAVAAAINTGSQSSAFLGMYFGEGMHIRIPLPISAGAMLVAAGTGLLAGTWPATKATRMSALEAMRGGSSA